MQRDFESQAEGGLIMRERDRRDAAGAAEPVAAPSACPACRSSEIKTTSKAVTEASYWRCIACGEVWNVTRRRTARYSPPRSPWGSGPFGG